MLARRTRVVVVLVAFGVLAVGVLAQSRPAITIRTFPAGEHVYMLAGAGGNLALLVGDDGALMVDAEYGQISDLVLAAVKELTDQPLRLVINTHWHFDHVGGNENLAKAGALLIAHENVRKKMSSEQVLGALGRTVPPSPPGALPVLTFNDQLTLHWNGEDVEVSHVDPPAHTDGDSFVYFRKANVLHVADVYFNGMYPFIDVNAGGTLDGMIQAVDKALVMADAETKIIPGHGAMSNVTELRAYRDMLATARDRIKPLVEQGKSRDEVIAAKPTAELDEKWGQGGFPPDQWVGIVYDGMTRK
ncbi:MAG: MBL fold metallo-hydrolase [Phycisphaerae bacterium]|jgi:glyoxylase-like metal-dependent hydrolase (beta-lactamase superfamily II)